MSFRDHFIGFILRARQIRGQVDDLEAEIVKGETKGGFQGMKHKLEFERRKRVVCTFDRDFFRNIMKRSMGDLAYELQPKTVSASTLECRTLHLHLSCISISSLHQHLSCIRASIWVSSKDSEASTVHLLWIAAPRLLCSSHIYWCTVSSSSHTAQFPHSISNCAFSQPIIIYLPNYTSLMPFTMAFCTLPI